MNVEASVANSYLSKGDGYGLLINALSGNDTLRGSAGNDTLIGGEGRDTLDGSTGNDILIGGAGRDTYVVDSVGDVVTETGEAGEIDTVQASVSWTLGTNLERLVLTGTANINGTGNILDNVLTGNSGANILDGGTGNDTLDGGAGDDRLTGGDGSDTYVVDSAADVIMETGAASENDTVQASVSWTLGANLENLTLIGSAGIDGTGNALANVILGNSSANTLDGGGGDDTLSGGFGDDTYVVDSSGDVITEFDGYGTDTVRASLSWTLGASLENLILTGSASIDGTGNSLNNAIIGNSGVNVLDGGAGSDFLDGGAGDDTLIGGDGYDTYVVDSIGDIVTEVSASGGGDTVRSSVSWTLGANLENLTLLGSSGINGTGNVLDNVLTGNSGANILDAGAGNDTLDGGAGNDTLIGGDGRDTYVVDSAADVIVETGAVGEIDIVQSSVSWTLSDTLESLALTGAANINGTGNGLNNVLTGNSGANILDSGAGNDTLDGGAGDDTLIGGGGSDTYMVDSAADVIVETGAAGETDMVQSSVSWVLGANLEDLGLTGSAAINATGNALNNFIGGNTGANTLDGGAGNDTLSGDRGNDTYVVDSTGDVIIEAAVAGEIDTVLSSVSWTLGANLENLTLTGAASLNGTGNALANVLIGNAGGNTLDGGAGADTLIGGAGNDTLIGGDGGDSYGVDSVGDMIIETGMAGEIDAVESSVSWTLAANLENLTLIGTDSLNGTGNALVNVIVGNASANTLVGGAGADTLIGGTGNDTYVVDNAFDVITEAGAGDGGDSVLSSVSWTLGANLENLTLTGSAAINGTGNALDNVIVGNDGANTLDGGAGYDRLAGGSGNDTYVVSGSSVVILEKAGEGIDTVQSTVTAALASNVENLTLGGADAILGVGNKLDNVLIGNSANNILDGKKGNDTLAGGGGADILLGGDGADTLSGGGGNDTLYGGGGADQFWFDTASEGGDTVGDFKSGTDKVVVHSTNFGNLPLGLLSSAAFAVNDGANLAQATFLFNSATHTLAFDADGSGAGAAVVIATFTNNATLSSNDILVVDRSLM